MPTTKAGPCIALVDDGEGGQCQCGTTESSCWYGPGKIFCASHRAAWNRWKKQEAAAEQEEAPSALAEAEEVLGTRYCEPADMKWYERYNDVEKHSLEFCVQGDFKFEGMRKGHSDIRWLSVEELVKTGCSKESFVSLTDNYIEALKKTFKNDAKRFKSAASASRRGR